MPADPDGSMVAGPDGPAPPPLAVARSVADSAMGHGEVIALDAGLAGEFATYGLGGRVPGVRIDRRESGGSRIRLRVVARYGRPLSELGDVVRSAVRAGLAELGVEASVEVHVADVVEARSPGGARALRGGSA